MKDSNILYILPVPKYFSQAAGIGGHVAHTHGIIDIFTKCGYVVDVIAEETHPVLQKSKTSLHIKPIGSSSILKRQIWGIKLVLMVKKIKQKKQPVFCYMRYSMGFTPLIPLLKMVLGKIPLVLEVNSFGTQYYKVLRGVDIISLNCANIIVCVSETVQEEMLKNVSPKLKSRILVMPNGIDIERFYRKDTAIANVIPVKEARIGYTGILKSNYGFDDLFRAFSIVCQHTKNVSLHIYGDGPYRKSLEKQSRLLSKVYLHGPVSYFDIPKILNDLDMLIYTSSHQNKFQSPIKLYEYMASKRPIVAAAIPQVRDLLGYEERGLLYPLGDANTLAEKIITLLDNPEYGALLAERAFAEVKNKHTWSKRITLLFDRLNKYD